MPALLQIVLKVEPFIFSCPGIVRGVVLPSRFSRIMEMCSFSLTSLNPRFSKALITRRLGASTGNLSLNIYPGFSNEGFENRRLKFKSILTESLDMKTNGGFY